MSFPYTPTEFTSLKYQSDKNNACFYGMASFTYGLAQVGAINGFGLVTNGFLWQGPGIWFDAETALNLSTGWTAASGYSGSATLIATGWTAAAGYSGSSSVISTTWTATTFAGDLEF